MSAKLFLYLSAGGIAGTLARYLLSNVFQSQSNSFPWATLAINLAGSFVLGLVARSMGSSTAVELRIALTVGFCGAFTTMSTFAYESVGLMKSGQATRAATYIVASVGGSMLAALAGIAVGGKL